MDEHTFKRRIAVDTLNNNGLGNVHPGDASAQATTTSFRACRNKFENILREGQIIRLEHAVTTASMDDNGKNIEISFSNSLKLRPSIVVDTEDVHS